VRGDAVETGLQNGNGRIWRREALSLGFLAMLPGRRAELPRDLDGLSRSPFQHHEEFLVTTYAASSSVIFMLLGVMLALFGFASYSTAVHKLEAIGRMVMYTDWIVEASNADGEFYGHVALCNLVTRTRHLSPAMAADSIISSDRQWSVKKDDDLTALICDYTPRVDDCNTALCSRC